MNNVLVLIAAPGGLDHSIVAAMGESLKAFGATAGAPSWLSENEACEIPFTGADLSAAEAAARDSFSGRPVDVAALAAAGRRKRLLVADLESTIIANEMVDEMADIAALGPETAAITARTMAGDLDFAESLRLRAKYFANCDASLLSQATRRMRLNPGAAALVSTMRAHGAATALVSGGFDIFAQRIARDVGFDHCHANHLQVAQGRISGDLAEPILDGAAKPKLLEELCQYHGLTPDDVIAVGDGANDIPMLERAGLGVTYCGKPITVAAADARIEHGDLTALLFLQGYRREEFAL